MAVAPEASRAVLAAEASETAEQLFQQHSGWIYGYCLRLLRSPEEAEDAVQTTYLNAWRSLGGGTRPEVGSAWLLRIAQNVCFTRLRSSGRRGRLERVQDLSYLEDTVAAPERAPVELIGLTDALCSIPERQREAILLREWQGLSYAEIADRLELSQAAVETLIFRARRSLSAALEAPPTRGRRKVLHALDFGGLAAALKGLFAGSAGVKAVAALTVAAATTATVVATDHSGVWRDRPDPVAPRITPPAQSSSTGSAPGETALPPGAALLPPDTPGRPGAGPRPGEKPAEPGRGNGPAAPVPASGHDKAESPGNAPGNGNGKALGLAKEKPEPGSRRNANAVDRPSGAKPDREQPNKPAPTTKPEPPSNAEPPGKAESPSKAEPQGKAKGQA